MKVEFRAITNNLGTLESPVIMFSVIPSLKNSCLGSPLILTKGSTAMEGNSGRGKAIFFGSALSTGGEGVTVFETFSGDGGTTFSLGVTSVDGGEVDGFSSCGAVSFSLETTSG